MFLRDTAVAPALLKGMEERRYQRSSSTSERPILQLNLGQRRLHRELERPWGATQPARARIHDPKRDNLFTFA